MASEMSFENVDGQMDDYKLTYELRWAKKHVSFFLLSIYTAVPSV